MDCPKCGGGMTAVEFGTEIKVMRCHGCAGLYCKDGDLERMRREWLAETLDTGSATTGRNQDAKTNITCPACDAEMIRVQDKQQPHITLEVCSGCAGTFLDAGELTDIKSVTLMDQLRRLLGVFQRQG